VPLTAPHALSTQRAKPLNDHLEQQLLFYCVNHYPEEHEKGASAILLFAVICVLILRYNMIHCISDYIHYFVVK
jgi:hypothetical protein